jgi:hypothetical protein
MAKGISLHIGVNRLNPVCYPMATYQGWETAVVIGKNKCVNVDGDYKIGWNGRLGRSSQCCEKDAEDLAAIASKQGFKAKVLLTKRATSARVERAIRNAAKKLTAGDIFLLSYAGHGSQVEDLTNDEADNEDETWCLYDRMFLDDEQRMLYTEFAEGVRILVLCDSCHSGTATRSGKSDAARRRRMHERLRARAMPRETASCVYLGRKSEYDEIQLGLPNPPPKLKASRILLSACQDNETAMGDLVLGGCFTRALKKIWNKGAFESNYEQFAEEIKLELKRQYEDAVKKQGGDASNVHRQRPNFVAVADGEWPKDLADFVNQKPFTV